MDIDVSRQIGAVVREVRNWPAHLSGDGLVAEAARAGSTNYRLWPNNTQKDKQIVR